MGSYFSTSAMNGGHLLTPEEKNKKTDIVLGPWDILGRHWMACLLLSFAIQVFTKQQKMQDFAGYLRLAML